MKSGYIHQITFHLKYKRVISYLTYRYLIGFRETTLFISAIWHVETLICPRQQHSGHFYGIKGATSNNIAVTGEETNAQRGHRR